MREMSVRMRIVRIVLILVIIVSVFCWFNWYVIEFQMVIYEFVVKFFGDEFL